MGVHNWITEAKYKQIKAVLKVPADDRKAMKKFGIGASTCRNIRNTHNFLEYSARVGRSHRYKAVRPIFIPAGIKPDAKKTLRELKQLEPVQDNGFKMLGLGILVVLGVLLLAFFLGVWAFSKIILGLGLV